MTRSIQFLIAAALVFGPVPDATAIDVVTTFVGGEIPQNATGGGNLTDIVNAAAARWGQAYPESFTLRLYYGWAATGSAGTHTLIDKGGEPERELTGLILFDNTGAVSYYLDPTPSTDDEYRRYTEEYQDLGGGLVNVARVLSEPAGDAAGRCDLLSVAMHEIGHALGMGLDNPGFVREAAGGAIVIDERYPSSGTRVPLAANNYGTTSHFDAAVIAYGSLMTGICADERRLPSNLDLLANAQISGFRYSIPDRDQRAERVVIHPDPEGRPKGFLR